MDTHPIKNRLGIILGMVSNTKLGHVCFGRPNTPKKSCPILTTDTPNSSFIRKNYTANFKICIVKPKIVTCLLRKTEPERPVCWRKRLLSNRPNIEAFFHATHLLYTIFFALLVNFVAFTKFFSHMAACSRLFNDPTGDTSIMRHNVFKLDLGHLRMFHKNWI